MTQQDAIQYIREQLALNDVPSTWSYEDRIRYNKALAEFEQANPGIFPNSISSVVDNIAAKPYDPLQDDSFSFSMFTDELANNANKALGFSFLTLRNLLFVAVILFVGIFAWRKSAK